MTPPIFRCSSVKDTSLRLHYTPGRKTRHSLAPLIVGIVKALVDLVVKNVTNLSIVQEKATGNEQAVFLITWSKTEAIDSSDSSITEHTQNEATVGLSAGALCAAFPFHIVMNSNAEIVQIGPVCTSYLLV
jgi:hypothetical protein